MAALDSIGIWEDDRTLPLTVRDNALLPQGPTMAQNPLFLISPLSVVLSYPWNKEHRGMGYGCQPYSKGVELQR